MKLDLPRLLSTLTLVFAAAAAHAGDAPVVSDAWSRATAPGVEVGAAYLVIKGGRRDDRLVGASSKRADMVHLHDVVEEDGVAKMRSTGDVPVPAGQRVELAPKGKHLMLMGLDAPLVEGQTYTIVLRFADAGEQTVAVTVRAATEVGGAHAHH